MLHMCHCVSRIKLWTSMSLHRVLLLDCLTHWGRVTHICAGKLTIIGSDNGLSPVRRQAIIWTNAGIVLIRPLETNFSEISIEIHTFSFRKMHLKMSSGKWRPLCLGLNVLRTRNSHRRLSSITDTLLIHHQSRRHVTLLECDTFNIHTTPTICL